MRPLFTNHAMFKVAYGGRGGGKSEAFAGKFLTEGLREKHKYLNVREVQESISKSVYATYELVARRLRIYSEFKWTQSSIIAKGTGSEYLFSGLSGLTEDNLKSIPGVDRGWVEEGQTVAHSSWNIFKPTVFRNPGAEIYVSLNPRLEGDAIYEDLLSGSRDNVIAVQINLDDNPWASAENKSERDRDYEKDPESAAHIWGGALRPSVEGAIYGLEMAAMDTSGRLGTYPHNPALSTIVGFDLGGSSMTADHTSFVIGQHVAGERRVVMAHEGRGQVFSFYLDLLKRTGWRIDKIALPHDAENHNGVTHESIADLTRAAFPTADVVVNPRTNSVASDINFVRERFNTVTINKATCEPLVQAMRCYRWDISKRTGLAMKPLHDTYSDTADAFRTWIMQEAPTAKPIIPTYNPQRKASLMTRPF